MVKTVVVLGASYAGLAVAHRLMKLHDKDLKVVLVSKVRAHPVMVVVTVAEQRRRRRRRE